MTSTSTHRVSSRRLAQFGRAIALLALSFALLPVSGAVADSSVDDCSLYKISTGRSPILHVVNGVGEFKIAKRGDQLKVWQDGDRIPESHLSREGSILKILDGDGETLLMVGVFRGFSRDGQLAYSQDLDPWSLLSRFGLTTDEPEKSVAELLRVDPRRSLAVDKICADRPAAAAGLRSSDLIVGIEGQRFSDAAELVRRAAAASPGETVELTVERRDGQQKVALVAAPMGDWPSNGVLESHLLQVVNE